jgi:hypothetical protein
MMRRLAVVGDRLSTGGQIDSYTGPVCTWGDGGHQVALIGGDAYCEACKTTGSIAKAGGPRRLQFLGEAALDGDIIICNCATPPRIVAKLAGESWFDDEDHRAVAPTTNTPQSVVVQSAIYDQHFRLADERTGMPLKGVPYRIVTSDGEEYEGRTDVQGHTLRVSNDWVTSATLHVLEDETPINPYWDRS